MADEDEKQSNEHEVQGDNQPEPEFRLAKSIPVGSVLPDQSPCGVCKYPKWRHDEFGHDWMPMLYSPRGS